MALSNVLPKVLVVSADVVEYRRLLEPIAQEVTLLTAQTTPQAQSLCTDAEILFGDPDLLLPLLLPMHEQLPRLRWIQSSWAGVAPLIEALKQQPNAALQLTNVRGIFGPLMTEYVFTYLLGHERQVLEHRQAQQQRQWRGQRCGSLQGKTLGLLGLGSIGAHLARTARHFGMRVLGCSRTAPEAGLVERHYLSAQLEEMAAEVDYLVCTLPSTAQTRNLIGAPLLARMKSTAVLLNAGRGDLIDDEALVEALRQQQIAAAVLDVFRQEPLPQAHPFWTTPNLIITSHTAAPSFPAEIAPLFIDNLRLFQQGRALNHRVDIQRGY
ncbi:MAG: phosphoglycerate dehydrogenase-like enzyme [Motiliproteus sp.]|jgi:phosphoglycerate dehydrogenase-like enzyme